MNTMARSVSTANAEVPLTREAKMKLLQKMYSLAHWIELIRLIRYQIVPTETARQMIQPLADQYGKEKLASAFEVLFEIFMQEKQQFTRLKPHIRRMAFQILGPEPTPGVVTPTPAVTAPTSDQHADAVRPQTAETKKAKKPAKGLAAVTADAVSPLSGRKDSLMQQYRTAKERHPGMLLLFRMGDFYELFDQDAEMAHKLLGLTLTTRDQTLAMAGFPHHQLETYLHKLLKEGQRVAICEQVDDSLERGPIRREVTRVVTPGTAIDEDRSNACKGREAEQGKPDAEVSGVKQPRHLVLKRFEAWLSEAGLTFVSVKDVRRTNPAVAPYVGVLDFIVLRGDEKLLVTVRPHLQAKHFKAVRELQNVFGPEYKPMRMWPSEGPDRWNWHDHPVDMSAPADNADHKPKPRRSNRKASQ